VIRCWPAHHANLSADAEGESITQTGGDRSIVLSDKIAVTHPREATACSNRITGTNS